MAWLVGPPGGGDRTAYIANTIEIRRAPHLVWPYLVDWERLDRWMSEADRFRVTGDRREGVGVEAEARVRIAGITTHDRIRVLRWEPPWVLEMEHLGWVRGRGYMELTPGQEGGTTLFWREELIPPWGVLGRIGMRLLKGRMSRIFRGDLQQLRRLVESGA
ncbi:MAG TPA: SRPBCC family protein [Actinomycetota bacterium]|nr:SRPBCC family protein [Actinomycetota bacterium]